MLHTQFQVSEASVSEEEDFLIFSTYFYDSNPRTLCGRAILYPRTLHLNIFGRRPLDNATY